MTRILLLLPGVCALLTLGLARQVAPTPPPDPAQAACASNPYYAKAILAMEWMAAHPPENGFYSGDMYSHAVLDARYDSLFAQGLVPPVPPPCRVTARQDQPVYSAPDAASAALGSLAAGESADLYARSEDAAWWYVRTDGGAWGWVPAAATDLQPGADISAMMLGG